MDSSELFITEYLGKVEEVLRNLNDVGYFYVTELDTERQLVYYVTDDLYLPLNVVDKMTPGLYKNIKFIIKRVEKIKIVCYNIVWGIFSYPLL